MRTCAFSQTVLWPFALSDPLEFQDPLLLQHALVDAAERGNETTTLVSTALGYPVYERLGYRTVGRLAMWERAAGT